MTDQIFSREAMRKRGMAAFPSKGRDDHGMNAGAAAIADWQDGWDYAASLVRKVSRPAQADARPPLHATRAGGGGFDVHQVGGAP